MTSFSPKRDLPKRAGHDAMAPMPFPIPPHVLVIACGALAKEIRAIIDLQGWHHISLTCLPAIWHNQPEKIVPALREKILAVRGHYDRILIGYGDCGTGPAMDGLLAETGARRLDAPHCYAVFAGGVDFTHLMEEEPGSFFVTDYLLRHFDQLVIGGLGIDRHPELLPQYFGHYRRLIHLAQCGDPELAKQGPLAATRLGLAYEYRYTGYGGLEDFLRAA